MTLYKLYETITNLSVGGWLSVLVIMSLFIEVSPIKVNPIAWFGERLNAPMYKRVDEIEKKLDDHINQSHKTNDKIEKKLDEHIAQSYRNKILSFQDSILAEGANMFTKEQYDEVIDAIEKYEKHCEDNDIDNDKCVFAIKYINRCYTNCQNNRSFSNLNITDN